MFITVFVSFLAAALVSQPQEGADARSTAKKPSVAPKTSTKRPDPAPLPEKKADIPPAAATKPRVTPGSSEPPKSGQGANAQIAAKKKYRFWDLMTLCEKRTFAHYDAKSCSQVRAFNKELRLCSVGSEPEYESAHCVAVRRRAAKAEAVVWAAQEAEFITCFTLGSSEYNLKQCVTYRNQISLAKKLEFCERKPFRWYSTIFCKNVRKKHYRKALISKYTLQMRSRYLSICFDRDSINYDKVACILFRKDVHKIGEKLRTPCLDASHRHYHQRAKCTKYRKTVFKYLKCTEVKVKRRRKPSPYDPGLAFQGPLQKEEKRLTFSIALSPIMLFSKYLDMSFEVRTAKKVGLSFSFGGGKVSAEENGEEYTSFNWGGQLKYYATGSFGSGLYFGMDFSYMQVNDADVSYHFTGDMTGAGLGGILGLKYTFGNGFMLEGQVGVLYMISDKDHGIFPLLNVRMGYSF